MRAGPAGAAPQTRPATAAPVVIFTTPGCPYCARAKDALRARGTAYTEVDASRDAGLRAALAAATGQRTVPQIYAVGTHVGGSDDLLAALADGRFDALLTGASGGSSGGGVPAVLPPVLHEAAAAAAAAAAAGPAVGSSSSGGAALPQPLVSLSGALADAGSGILAAIGGGGDKAFSGAQLLEWLAANLGAADAGAGGGAGAGNAGSPASLAAQLLAANVVTRLAAAQPSPADLAAVEPTGRYRLRTDAPRGVAWGQALNTAYWWSGPARPAAEVAEDLRARVLSLYDAHLSPDGRSVGYSAMRSDPAFWAYVDATVELQRVDLSPLGRDELVAFALNAYNALIIHALVVHGPDKYSSPVSRKAFFAKAARYTIGGVEYTADDLENGVLRGNRPGASALGMLLGVPGLSQGPFGGSDPRRGAVVDGPVDARIHFALVCGAKSCPPVKLYSAANLDEGLGAAADAFCAGDVEVDAAGRSVTLSKLFQWYYPDFGATKAERLHFLLPHLPPPKRAALEGLLASDPDAARVRVVHRPYDWSLNGQ